MDVYICFFTFVVGASCKQQGTRGQHMKVRIYSLPRLSFLVAFIRQKCFFACTENHRQ